jgi:dipeptidyl aminopeptidase/acylaminoacyl peptidase
MCLMKKLPVALCLVILSAAARQMAAAEKLNLDRETPVPATEQIPVMDFFRPLLLQQPKLNPSGTHIAAIVTEGEDRHQLLVYELKTQKIEAVSYPGDRDIYEADWLNDRRLIFQLSARKLYGVGLMAANVGSLTEAYPLLQYFNSSLLAVPPQNRLRPLVWNRYDGLNVGARRDLGVAVVNTDLNNGKMVDLLGPTADMQRVDYVRDNNQRHILQTFAGPEAGTTLGFQTDIEGRLEFAGTGSDGALALHHLVGDHWEKCPVDLEHIDIIDHGNEPGQLVVLGPRQEGKPRALQFMEGATGKLGDVLVQDTAYDFFGGGLSHGWLYRDPVKHQVIGAVFDRKGPQVVWFNEEYRTLQKILDGFFPGLVVRIISSDEAQKIFLVATFSDRQPVIYNWVDLEKRTAGLIKRAAPWIDRARMQPMNIIKFKTRDGHQLDAYLTLPAGASKTNRPPLVVLSHGGPWARDSWGFDGEVQFLASRGYAVVQPNYRGSNGYGWMFPEQDNWDFAKMHDDVTDATKTMIASGLIDPERIAIMGGSFGGYLAVAGVVHEPALYRCAVTIAGVFDWEQQIHDKKYDQYDSFVFGYMMHKLGDPKQQPAKFEAISPGRHADQIRVPVFVSGGTDDQTVEIEQSRALISSLARYHVPHETYIVGEEGHGMHHLDKQVELYTRIEAFLAKNLAPARPDVSHSTR